MARRLAAEAVGMVFATRVLSEEPAGLPEFAVRRPAGYVCALGPSREAPQGIAPLVRSAYPHRRGTCFTYGWPRWNDLKNRRFCSDVAVSAR